MTLPSADFASGEIYASLVASRIPIDSSEEDEPLPSLQARQAASALDTGADIPRMMALCRLDCIVPRAKSLTMWWQRA